MPQETGRITILISYLRHLMDQAIRLAARWKDSPETHLGLPGKPGREATPGCLPPSARRNCSRRWPPLLPIPRRAPAHPKWAEILWGSPQGPRHQSWSYFLHVSPKLVILPPRGTPQRRQRRDPKVFGDSETCRVFLPMYFTRKKIIQPLPVW